MNKQLYLVIIFLCGKILVFAEGNILIPQNLNQFYLENLTMSIHTNIVSSEYHIKNKGIAGTYRFIFLNQAAYNQFSPRIEIEAKVGNLFLSTDNHYVEPVFYKFTDLIADFPSINYSDYNVFVFDIPLDQGNNLIELCYSITPIMEYGENTIQFDFSQWTNWSNKTIPEFNVDWYPPTKKLFDLHLPPSNLNFANWEILGSGNSIGNAYFLRYGFLSYKGVDFEPNGKFGITVYNNLFFDITEYGYVSLSNNNNDQLLCIYRDAKEAIQAWYGLPFDQCKDLMLRNLRSKLENVDKKGLRILRNFPFALSGYKFKSTDLDEYFSQYIWYLPSPNIKAENIPFLFFEKLFIQVIIEIESEKEE